MSEMEYRKLSDCAEFRSDRTTEININTYITTENMIKNKGGISVSNKLPEIKTASAYKPSDILISNIRPYFKKIWYSNRFGSCSNDVLVISPNNDMNPKFLFYVLSDNNFFNYATVTSKGTKMPRGTQSAIMKYLVPKIDILKQEKIADILSAYDDLIGNNNERIKLLEQMAENLYKEWFVRFRFPGYADTEFENGIPKSWKIERLSNIADIIMGQSPKSENYNTNCEGLPFHQGVGSYGDFYLIDGIYSTKGNRIAEANSIIFSVRAPVGRINITLNKIILGRGVASINSVKGYNAYLLWMLKNQFQQEDIIGNGSIFTSVTKKELFGFKILMPHEDLIQKFDSIVSGIESEMRKLSLINNNLEKQRDFLLPRLMSGKLEV